MTLTDAFVPYPTSGSIITPRLGVYETGSRPLGITQRLKYLGIARGILISIVTWCECTISVREKFQY